jgi:hypothetical protein
MMVTIIEARGCHCVSSCGGCVAMLLGVRVVGGVR